jgi:hypothetical protein
MKFSEAIELEASLKRVVTLIDTGRDAKAKNLARKMIVELAAKFQGTVPSPIEERAVYSAMEQGHLTATKISDVTGLPYGVIYRARYILKSRGLAYTTPHGSTVRWGVGEA